jgi:hypothetical protein
MSQEFIVQLPNRPGELSHLARALCARGVNIVQIRELTAGTVVSAHLFTDCCDDDTRDVLRCMGYSYVAGSSLEVEVEDSPCGFAEIGDKLAAEGVQIKGFCILGRAHGRATWALEVDKEEVARKVLGLSPARDLASPR